MSPLSSLTLSLPSWQHLQDVCFPIQPYVAVSPPEGPASQAVDTKPSGGAERACPSDTGAGAPGTAKVRLPVWLTDMGCWDCGNLATELEVVLEARRWEKIIKLRG